MLRLAIIIFLVGCSADSVLGQMVRGRVVERGSGGPVWGAFVVLLDEQGIQRAAVLTDSLGAFVLRAQNAGSYTIRAERIGLQSVSSGVLSLMSGASETQQLEMGVAPFKIEEIGVTGSSRCNVRQDMAVDTYWLWEEARKALSVAAWLQRGTGVPHRAVVYERRRDLATGRLTLSVSRLASARRDVPFFSKPATDLAAHGYVRQAGTAEYQYFGLDAATVLSDAFVDTHCFRVVESDAGQSHLIGLAFEPIQGHRQPDVAGTLWLDRASSEIRFLEFEFTQHLGSLDAAIRSYDLPRSLFGGRVDFRRIANGGWITDEWWIRMPQVVMTEGEPHVRSARPATGLRDRLIAASRGGLFVWEAGGRTLYLSEPSWAASSGFGSVRGVVYDSSRSLPLVGATVILKGTNRTARTDIAGRFEIRLLSPRLYEIAFLHPQADALAVPISFQEVAVGDSGVSLVELGIPRSMGCPETGNTQRNTGAIVGFVYNAVSGEVVGEGRVTASWGRSRTTVDIDEGGRFIVCGVAIGTTVTIQARNRSNGPAVHLTLSTPGVSNHDLLLYR